MAEENKSSEIQIAESNLKVLKLIERIEELTFEGKLNANKDIVAFVGPTKAGKSTLINCLLGTELLCKRDELTGDTYLIKASELDGPTIGDKESGQSETEKPEVYQNLPGTNFAMWDFAGFGDNKGTEQEIVNAISYKAILLQQNTVRFVFVVPSDLVKSADLLPFYKLLWELKKIFPLIADCLCIVASKIGKDKCAENLLKRASQLKFDIAKVGKSNLEMINESKEIIGKVLEKGTSVEFNFPELDQGLDEGSFILPNSEQFVECIKKLNGTKVNDFPLVISDQAKCEIAELYAFFYKEVKAKVESMSASIEKFIQRKIDDILNQEGANAESKLAFFKTGKSTIVDLMKNSKDFESFFGQAENAGIEMSEIYSKTLDKFVFIEDLKNKYKLRDTEQSMQGKEEFFTVVERSLQNGAKKYSVVIETSEAATKEEKMKEKEWQKQHEEEVKVLNKKLKKLANYNKALVVGASLLAAADTIQQTAEFGASLADKRKQCLIL